MQTVSLPRCEVVLSWWSLTPTFCGMPAEWCYPAMGGGYMHLCAAHAERHKARAHLIQMERIADAAR